MRKFSLFFFLASLVLASCAGLKKPDRPRYDLMDNLTSRYNIVFHSKQLIEAAEQENIQAFRPNFFHELPIFIEPTESSALSHAPLMDSVLTKTRRVIHEKEKGKYLDDAYFLMGKANYLKGQYYHAAEFFAYVANTYTDQPKRRQEAWIWQARALLHLGAVNDASVVMDSIFTYVGEHRKQRGHAYATRAAFHLERGEKQEAVTFLKAAVEQRGNRNDKLRWHFLLGQLLEEQQLYAEAVRHYRRVARSNVSYEMAFQAGLSQVFIAGGFSDDPDAQVRPLRRMLRADKNKEFRDQIHYYIAEAYLMEGDTDHAQNHYRHALNQVSSNMHQKTQTYMSLADLFLAERSFNSARAYYDSAATVLPPDFRDVDLVRRKLMNIPDLIDNLVIVEEEDELQYLARLSPAQREVAIDSLIGDRYQILKEAEAEIERQRLEGERQGQTAGGNLGIQRSPFDEGFGTANTNAYADNRFYFNNPDAVGMGVSAFRRQWGNRPLEDDWRLAARHNPGADAPIRTAIAPNAELGLTGENQVSELSSGEAEWAVEGDVIGGDSLTFFTQQRERFGQKLPLSDSTMMDSHAAIQEALASNGEIYRFNLRDYPQSIHTYENLIGRYPTSAAAASWLFQLFQLYQPIDAPQAERYRDQLLERFPESNYAQIILDPGYLQRVEQEKRRSDAHYAVVYALYSEGKYVEVLGAIEEEMDRSGPNAQFGYLRALAVGRTAGLSDFEDALKQLVQSFPEDSLVTPLAQEHLTFLAANPDQFAGREPVLEALDGMSERLLEEPRLTPWPQLVIHSGPIVTRGTPQQGAAGGTGVGSRSPDVRTTAPQRELGAAPTLARTAEQRTYRDLALLPDTATYYFVIHVMHPTANLAPSRFGIGQFNRSRYADAGLSHQLKSVNNESQLIYMGPFSTYADAQVYEARFMPMIEEIMKIAADAYHSFLITESVFGTLSDFRKIDDYYNFYSTQ